MRIPALSFRTSAPLFTPKKLVTLLAGAVLLFSEGTATARPPFGVRPPPGGAVIVRAPAPAPRPPLFAPKPPPPAPLPVVVRPPVVVVPPPPPAPVVVATTPLPDDYISILPAGHRAVVYRGATCYFVHGVYYRPTFYAGRTVYVIVR